MTGLGFPLQRAAGALRTASAPFDLLVVGGGIYGAWIACDAAQRGLRVALVEARDWGAGTSSSSSKLIHGGLRYLERFELGLVRESLNERRTLTRIAPHLVRPLRFAVPVWRGDRVGRFKLGAGLTLYDLLAGRDQPVAPHRRLSRQALTASFPYIAGDGLRSGFEYGDCQEDDARLTLEVVAAAQAAGARCVNRMAALSLTERGGRVCGATLRDGETGETFELEARAVVAAAGPWSRELLGTAAPAMKLIRGVHLVLPALPNTDRAFLLTAPQDGRVFFVIPWYGRTLLGTTETSVADPAQAVVTAEDRGYLLEAAAARLPGAAWSASNVLASFAGVRTLQAAEAGSLSAMTREFELLRPRPGLWMPLGGKYTTSRADAEHVLDALLSAEGWTAGPCRSATTPLAGAATSERPPVLPPGIDDFVLDSLRRRYGGRASAVLDLLLDEPALAQRIHPDLPFIDAELILARRDEMACDADDALRRRIPVDLLAAPGAWRDRAVRIFDTAPAG